MHTDFYTVTASEIGDFVFCPETWRLVKAGGRPTPAILAARERWKRHHGSPGVAKTTATRSIRRGRFLIAVRLAAIVVLVVLSVVAR